jgi:hypothetical protein
VDPHAPQAVLMLHSASFVLVPEICSAACACCSSADDQLTIVLVSTSGVVLTGRTLGTGSCTPSTACHLQQCHIDARTMTHAMSTQCMSGRSCQYACCKMLMILSDSELQTACPACESSLLSWLSPRTSWVMHASQGSCQDVGAVSGAGGVALTGFREPDW